MSQGAHQSGRSGLRPYRRRLLGGLITTALLSSLIAGLLLAIPDLGVVSRSLGRVPASWLAVATALELASCVGYVLAFQGVFGGLPRRYAALVASAEQAFGAVVPLGGAGGIAAGGWLLARSGMPARQIAERSVILFLLTSATNVVALLLAAGGLAVGWLAGPHDAVRSVLPAGVALAVLLAFLSLARRSIAGRRGGAATRPAALRAIGDASAETLRLILRPGWRLAIGATAYLLCDVAVLSVAIHAVGPNVPVAALLVAYLVGYLANAIPIPGGLGVLDGGLAGALIAYHVPATPAVAGVLIYHALALWIPTVLGTLAFVAAARTSAADRGRRRTCQTGGIRTTTAGRRRRLKELAAWLT